MASGIETDPSLAELFNDVKLGKKKYKYLVFCIEDKKLIRLEEQGPLLDKPTETREECSKHFAELKLKLTELKEPRYIVYDFGFTNSEGRKLNKMAFIMWCPDNMPIGARMIYASSKDSLKKQLVGLAHEFQANDAADFDYDDFAGEVERKA